MKAKKTTPKKSPPQKPMSAQSLENRALYYLQRFSATRQGLRQVLARKLKRHAGADSDPVASAAMIDALVAKLEAAGYVDDARFAESRTASLTRRGTSQRAIAAKLRGKGVSAPLVKESLAEHDEQAAAHAFARRKKLGTYRIGATSKERARKDLAAMARAGFSFATIRHALRGG